MTPPSWPTSQVVEFSSMSGWWWLCHGLAIKALPQCRGERSMKPDPPQCHGEPSYNPMSWWRTLANALDAEKLRPWPKTWKLEDYIRSKKTKKINKQECCAWNDNSSGSIQLHLVGSIWTYFGLGKTRLVSNWESNWCRLELALKLNFIIELACTWHIRVQCMPACIAK